MAPQWSHYSFCTICDFIRDVGAQLISSNLIHLEYFRVAVDCLVSTPSLTDPAGYDSRSSLSVDRELLVEDEEYGGFMAHPDHGKRLS